MKRKLFIFLCLMIFACTLTGCGKKNTIKLDGNGSASIKVNPTKSIELEEYSNGMVSLLIPKGWKVEVPPVDYIHYNFKVYNPENPDYIFFFGLKFEGYMKTNRARNWQIKWYPSVMFAKLPAIEPQTTEAFYKVWNIGVDYSNREEVKYEYFRHINDFNVIEEMGKDMVGGTILRANFKNDNGDLMQGIFTAAVKSAGTYYVNENPLSLYSAQIDVSPLMVYNIMYMSTPDDDFINWQPILDKCLGSIEFSQKFVDEFYKEEKSVVQTIKANQKIYDQISDMIMDSWEKRNNSYDIISQKQSDATLGYERVYDVETGDIYKAYNGFTDEYSGNRYVTISDDMYTQSITGYIEKN